MSDGVNPTPTHAPPTLAPRVKKMAPAVNDENGHPYETRAIVEVSARATARARRGRQLGLSHLVRRYAPAIGDDVTQITWDSAALTVALRGHPGVPTEHDVFWNLGTPRITCDGANVPPPPPDDRHVFTLECGSASGDHVFVFRAGS
jgi:hypothetical protein